MASGSSVRASGRSTRHRASPPSRFSWTSLQAAGSLRPRTPLYSTFYDPHTSETRPTVAAWFTDFFDFGSAAQGDRPDGRVLRLQLSRVDRLPAGSQHQLRDLQRPDLHEPGRPPGRGASDSTVTLAATRTPAPTPTSSRTRRWHAPATVSRYAPPAPRRHGRPERRHHPDLPYAQPVDGVGAPLRDRARTQDRPGARPVLVARRQVPLWYENGRGSSRRPSVRSPGAASGRG